MSRMVFDNRRDLFGRDLLLGATQTALDVLRRDAVLRAPKCGYCGGNGKQPDHGDGPPPGWASGKNWAPCPRCDGEGVKLFTLSSGRPAKYYVDVARVSLMQPGFAAIAVLVANAAIRASCYCVGGPLVGAAPLATAAMVGFSQAKQVVQSNPNVPTWTLDALRYQASAFYLRDGMKAHGAGGRVVGTIPENSSIILVDDVVSTGESLMEAVEYVADLYREDAPIKKLFALVDRDKGAAERFAGMGIDYEYVFTMADLGLEQ